ncbi:hypothetical protein BDF20DRAFT_911568 [Mycotypha africana]|uniref:uncharacterized protein n=1 Tax=Mycotypha africana TaxID=64632 RepID=UPI0023000C09|nr:uncharacterized protein BDF20DRAFT_911568 [Mycotypha africana]KAI8984475.1 hypothetical protein BDF20DRAFT_911568 [Mycotypha africana]
MAEPSFEELDATTENTEREELIRRVLDLQSQLKVMLSRVDSARNDYKSLSTENQLLQKYINNSLTSTAVFGATNGAINSNNLSLHSPGNSPR